MASKIASSITPTPSGFLDARNDVSAAAFHSGREPYSDRIRCANDNFAEYQGHPKSHQQRRTLSHQAETTTDLTPQEMASLQTKLLQEASYLTRVLYRKCLQSINLLAKGNERDEADFADRENQERGGGVDLERISMAPPVNRQNELASRAEYYRAFTRENFDGHWSLLGAHGFHIGDEGNATHGLGRGSGGGQQSNQHQGGHHHLGGQMSAQNQGGGGESSSLSNAQSDAGHYMWREDQIKQFIYLIRSGEERRQWVMNDYEFEDPFNTPSENGTAERWSQYLEDRLKKFEAQTSSLVKDMYRTEGWLHSSDHGNYASEDDDFFSDSDSDDDQ